MTDIRCIQIGASTAQGVLVGPNTINAGGKHHITGKLIPSIRKPECKQKDDR